MSRFTIIPILLLALSCGNDIHNSGKSDITSKNEIVSILDFVLKDTINENHNIHFMFEERFNDSTYLAQIWLNGLRPKHKKYTDSLSYLDKIVYIYDLDASQSIALDTSPFFVPDSKSWMILVLRRNTGLQVMRVNILSSYDENLEVEEIEFDKAIEH